MLAEMRQTLKYDDPVKYANELVTPRTRWLAIATGSVSGLAGSLSLGPLFFELPLILILGAILQRRSPRPGRWLMWLGAFYLTVDVGEFFGPSLLRLPHFLDMNKLIILSLFGVSLALVSWCDVTLVIDARRSRNVFAPANLRFPRPADWIVGLFAIYLTTSAGWRVWKSIYPWRHYGRLGILLSAVAYFIAVAAFDAAILVHAVKMYRGPRLQATVNP